MLFVQATAAEHYDSVEEMAAAADAVVVGRLSAMRPSRAWMAAPELGEDGMAVYLRAG